MKMNEKTREFEYNPYECCVELGGYGIVGVPRAEKKDQTAAGKVVKRIFSVLCGFFGACFIVAAIIGLFIMPVNEIDGIVNVFGYQVSENVATCIGAVSFFGGSMIAYAFFYLCNKSWNSAL